VVRGFCWFGGGTVRNIVHLELTALQKVGTSSAPLLLLPLYLLRFMQAGWQALLPPSAGCRGTAVAPRRRTRTAAARSAALLTTVLCCGGFRAGVEGAAGRTATYTPTSWRQAVHYATNIVLLLAGCGGHFSAASPAP